MRFSTLVLVASTAMQSALGKKPVEPIPGYEIVDISWAIEVAPGQVEILNGTVQEVIAQAIEINPAYELPDVPPAAAAAAAAAPGPATKPRSLQRRTVKFCNQFGSANVRYIREGVEYLHRVGGQPTLGPGPGKCARVSCSWNSAIYWCNDNAFSKTVTWDGIANSAYHITEICPWMFWGWDTYLSGQNFEATKWNTLVREDSC